MEHCFGLQVMVEGLVYACLKKDEGMTIQTRTVQIPILNLMV